MYCIFIEKCKIYKIMCTIKVYFQLLLVSHLLDPTWVNGSRPERGVDRISTWYHHEGLKPSCGQHMASCSQPSTLGDTGIQGSSTVRKAGLTRWLKGSQAPWVHSIGPQLQQSHSCSCQMLYNSLHNWVYDSLKGIQIFSNTLLLQHRADGHTKQHLSLRTENH